MNLRDFFIFSLLLLGLSPALTSAEVVDRVEAIVNKNAIYKSDVTRFKELVPLRAKVDPLFANQPLAKKVNATELEIVNFLVDEAIIVEKFPVNDSEVEQEINATQANLHIDRDQLKAAIAREGFKFEDYFKLMKVALAKRQLIDRDIRSKAVVSEDDLRAEYARDHAGSKSFHGSFHLMLMKVAKKDYKTAAIAKEQAQKIAEAARAGGEFPGEDLGYLAYSDMSPTLQKIVQKMGPEKTSDAIDDGSNFIIVKTGDVKSDVDSAPDREKDVLRSRLMESEFEHQIHLWLDRERSNNFVKINLKS
jgi:peptidyl-prolyl cis-trans isomerase SurA